MKKTKPILDTWAKMDKLHASANIPITEERGHTLAEVAERYGITSVGAKYRLSRWVKQGKLKTAMTMRNGRRTRVYQFVEEGKQC